MSIFSADTSQRIPRWSFFYTRSEASQRNTLNILHFSCFSYQLHPWIRMCGIFDEADQEHCLRFQFDSNEHWNCIVQWCGKFYWLSLFSWVFLAFVCLQFRRFQCHSSTRLQVEISLTTSINSTLLVHGWLCTDWDSILQSNDKFGIFLHCHHFILFLT